MLEGNIERLQHPLRAPQLFLEYSHSIHSSILTKENLMMEAIDASEISWLDSSGLQLMDEFLDDKDPAFMFPEAKDCEEPAVCRTSIINKLISTVYSGPTISDIESALSVTSKGGELHDGRGNSRHITSSLDKGLGKMENKYTLKIKLCGNGLADDGYKWRKYGQKSIKNSPNPRSYYRCTNPRCNAKKQVERSVEDPETLVVTYEGLHLHYTYSHFLLSQAPHHFPAAGLQAAKKLKSRLQAEAALPDAPAKSPSPMLLQEELGEVGNLQGVDQGHSPAEENEELFGDAMQNSQGLLEDVVPLLVRKPCNSGASSYDHFPASFPAEPSSAQSYSTTLSWNPFDYGILSSIM